MTKEIKMEIARPGTFTDARGRSIRVDAGVLREMAASYDGKKNPAPIVFGHPAENGPAYGWVKSLAMSGDVLKATVSDMPDKVRDLIAAKTYRNVSASWFPKKHKNSPSPETSYLRHVGLLGAARPAIPGLAEIELSGGDSDTVTVDFAIAPEELAPGSEKRDILDNLITTLKTVMSEEDVYALLSDDVRKIVQESKPDAPIDAASFDDAVQCFSGAITSRLQRADELEAEHVEFAQERQDRLNDDAIATAISEGRLAPFIAPRIREFMASLDDVETVEFSAAGGFEDEKTTLAAQFRQIIRAQPPIIELSETSRPDQSSNASDDADTRATRINEHREERAAAGEHLSASDAARSLGYIE